MKKRQTKQTVSSTKLKTRGSYQTRQGDEILAYLAGLGGEHITAGAIAGHFGAALPPVGTTTVYRHLEKLIESGKVRRYFLEGEESACYQYVEENAACREHFHLKCEKCGKLFHLDCEVLDDVRSHVLKDHKFAINPLRTVFYGLCKKCAK
ncbi:MAG: transcriptional repressor [Treponema sp.]|jgi:Fur family ferric uptake transcriptional regulator|nr:transcriptional repressor [Treponema sp.]